MKEIKFLLIGDSSSHTTTLMDIYLWQLHFGYAYHDHIIQHWRYHITLQEVSSFKEFQQILPSSGSECICICLLCFNVAQKKSFEMLENRWLRNILDLLPHLNAHIFLVALQCELKNRLLTKFYPQNHIKSKEVLNVCSLYNGRLEYLECLNFEKENVRNLFNKAISLVLYNK